MMQHLSLLILVVLGTAGCLADENPAAGWRFSSWDDSPCAGNWTFPDGTAFDCSTDAAILPRAEAPPGWTCLDRLHAMNGHLDIWRGPDGEAGMAWALAPPPGWGEAHTYRATATVGQAEARQTLLLRGAEGFAAFERALDDGDWLRFEVYGFKPLNFSAAGLTWDHVSIHAADFRSSLWPTYVLHLHEALHFAPQSYGAQGQGPDGPLWQPHPRSFQATAPDGDRVRFQIDVQSVFWPGFAQHWEAPQASPLDALRDDRTCPGQENGPTAI